MAVLLFVVYMMMGLFMGLAASCALGFALAAVVALLRIGKRGGNWWLLILYLCMGAAAASVFWGGLFLAGFIGDHTGYKQQMTLGVSSALFGFVGLFSIVPSFVKLAWDQTSGRNLG